MHILQEELGLPVLAAKPVKEGDDSHVIFTIGPVPPGWGMTLGNALRRVLLSSLPGAAATSVRIKGVQHEYTTLKGVRESVIDICLNLKQLKLRKFSKDAEVISLSGKGGKVLTAQDLKVSSDIEVLDPTLEIVTLVYSPVEKVRFDVEAARVGQQTNLEKLILDVQTNGSLTAQEALQFAAQLLKSYFEYFGDAEKIVEGDFVADFSRAGAQFPGATAEAGPIKESYTPIEILNFSPRTLNALINAGVGSIEQLTKCTESALSNFRGFGAKALEEVKQTLAERGLRLSDESDMMMG